MDRTEIEVKTKNNDSDSLIQVPFILYENSETRHEKKEKKLLLLIFILIMLLFCSNMLWLFVFQSYDYVSETYSQDGEGTNIMDSNNVEVSNGTEERNQKANQKEWYIPKEQEEKGSE